MVSLFFEPGRATANVVPLCLRFLLSYSQEIGVTETTVDIIEICDAYFAVECLMCMFR
jgi:hypothetical protein